MSRSALPFERPALPPAFSCDIRSSGRAAVWIRTYGELDLAAAARFEATLNRASRDALVVIVDLRELSFMDSAGAHVIGRVADRTRRHHQRLVLVRGPAQIERLFRLVGLSERVELVNLKPVLVEARSPVPLMRVVASSA